MKKSIEKFESHKLHGSHGLMGGTMSPEDAQAAGYDELNHGTGAGGGLLWVGGAWRSVVWIADQIGRVQVISGVVQYFFPEGVGRTPAGGWGNYTPPSHSDFQDNTRRVRILY